MLMERFSIAGVTAITNTDIVVYDSTLGPAGVAGSPINLGLTDPAGHVGAVTVSIGGVPSGWTFSEGTDNGDGTATLTQSGLDLSGTVALSLSDSNLSGAAAGGYSRVVPLLAKGWSHAAGETHLKVVPCRWRATAG